MSTVRSVKFVVTAMVCLLSVALPLLTVHAQTSPSMVLSDLPGRIMACSKQVANESMRLRCFDDAALAIEEMTRAASMHNQFAWSLRSAGAGIERKTTISIASTDAITGTDSISQKNAYFLAGSCIGAQVNFYLAFPNKAYDTPKEVIVRYGKDERLTIVLYPSESGKAMGLWSNESARDFLNTLSAMNGASFDFSDERVPVTTSFDLRGMPEAVRAMNSACKA